VTWFRDGTQLLLSGPAGPGGQRGIWTLSPLTGSLRKLHDDARNAAVFPDNSRIAFIAGELTQIWLMGAGGEQPRRILTAPEHTTFTGVDWSPGGLRLAYLRLRPSLNEVAIESCDLTGGQPTVIFSHPRLRTFRWAPDGRILYAMAEPPPNETSTNLWELRADPRTGKVAGRPRRLTNWAGYAFTILSVAADGRHLAFVRKHSQSDVFVGALDRGGTRLSTPWRFTVDDRIDWPGGWTRDSQAVLFYSDRNGQLDLLKQDVKARAAEPVAAGAEEKRWPQLSPDGAWILYLAWPRTLTGVSPQSGQLLRRPVAGGSSERVLDVQGYPGSARLAAEPMRLTASGHPDFRCPSLKGTACVVSEAQQKQLVFSAFDPLEGRKRELARIQLRAPMRMTFWDLSPDGAHIVYGQYELVGRLHILTLAEGVTRELSVKGWNQFESAAWTADGKALFVTSYSPAGSSLLRVTLDGEAQLLHKANWWMERLVPSPDGHYLAFGVVTINSDAWMIENLR
jgi:Tol biopolymer transport system component